MLISGALGSAGVLAREIVAPALAVGVAAPARAVQTQLEAVHALEDAGLWIADGALRILAAVVIGWALARLVCARQLHWSWATVWLGAGACAYLAGIGWLLTAVPPASALGAPAVLLAGLVAARASYCWQLADSKPGVALRGRDRARHAPADLLFALFQRVPDRLAGRAKALVGRGARSDAADAFLLGHTCDGRRAVRVPARHTIVVGATGAGKTVTMRGLLAAASAGMGAVVVDGKGDPALEADLERLARAHGRRFVAWSPQHTTRYSPFGHGTDTEIVDKALAAENWGDDYYLRLGQRFLGFAVRALRAAGREPTLSGLARYADPGNLEQLAPAMEEANPGSWNDLVACVPDIDRAERQAIAGTQHRLATLAESDVGPLLEPAAGHETVDLLEVVSDGDVAYFNLNADARPALSKMVGAAIVMDLVGISASMQRRDECMPTVVLLDDVQAFASEPGLAGVASLFARGRAAGLMLLLGTQSLADFRRARADAMDQLLDNRTTLIVHRLPGESSATRASRELGAREVKRLSEHLEGAPGRWRTRGSATRTDAMEPHVRPEELMELETGVAVMKTVGKAPCLVRVRRPC
jgi:hypothetical protein